MIFLEGILRKKLVLICPVSNRKQVLDSHEVLSLTPVNSGCPDEERYRLFFPVQFVKAEQVN